MSRGTGFQHDPITGQPGHEDGIIMRKHCFEFRGETGTAFVSSNPDDAVAVCRQVVLAGHFKGCRVSAKDQRVAPAPDNLLCLHALSCEGCHSYSMFITAHLPRVQRRDRARSGRRIPRHARPVHNLRSPPANPQRTRAAGAHDQDNRLPRRDLAGLRDRTCRR